MEHSYSIAGHGEKQESKPSSKKHLTHQNKGINLKDSPTKLQVDCPKNSDNVIFLHKSNNCLTSGALNISKSLEVSQGIYNSRDIKGNNRVIYSQPTSLVNFQLNNFSNQHIQVSFPQYYNNSLYPLIFQPAFSSYNTAACIYPVPNNLMILRNSFGKKK